MKRPLPGKAKSRPIQRNVSTASCPTKTPTPPRSSPESTSQKQEDDGSDQSSLGRGRYVVEPKHLDYNERHTVTAVFSFVVSHFYQALSRVQKRAFKCVGV